MPALKNVPRLEIVRERKPEGGERFVWLVGERRQALKVAARCLGFSTN